MTPSPPEPSRLSDRPPLRNRHRWTAIAIIVMLLLWSTVMYNRMAIRARWWAYQLTQADTPEQQQYYLTCLAAIRDQSLGALGHLLQHPDPAIRCMAVTVLEQCSYNASIPRLLPLLADADDDVAFTAAIAISRHGNHDQSIPVLKKILQDHADVSGRATAVALQQIGGTAAQAALLDAIERTNDPDLMAQLAVSLGMLQSQSAIPFLTDLLNDKRPCNQPTYAQYCARKAFSAMHERLQIAGVDTQALSEKLQQEMTVDAAARTALAFIDVARTANPSSHPATSPASSGTETPM